MFGAIRELVIFAALGCLFGAQGTRVDQNGAKIRELPVTTKPVALPVFLKNREPVKVYEYRLDTLGGGWVRYFTFSYRGSAKKLCASLSLKPKIWRRVRGAVAVFDHYLPDGPLTDQAISVRSGRTMKDKPFDDPKKIVPRAGWVSVTYSEGYRR